MLYDLLAMYVSVRVAIPRHAIACIIIAVFLRIQIALTKLED